MATMDEQAVLKARRDLVWQALPTGWSVYDPLARSGYRCGQTERWLFEQFDGQRSLSDIQRTASAQPNQPIIPWQDLLALAHTLTSRGLARRIHSSTTRFHHTPQPHTLQSHTLQSHTLQSHTLQSHTHAHTLQPHTALPHTALPHTLRPHNIRPRNIRPRTPQLHTLRPQFPGPAGLRTRCGMELSHPTHRRPLRALGCNGSLRASHGDCAGWTRTVSCNGWLRIPAPSFQRPQYVSGLA